MELTLIWVIAQREWRTALANKWLWFYALGFAGLAVALPRAGSAMAGYSGMGGFGRTAASLINALLLFVPLIGLSVGAGAIVQERERGTLLYLLAQPIHRAELFFGKLLGTILVVTLSLGLGFGLAGLELSTAEDGKMGVYLTLAGYTLLLALVSLGLGFVISSVAQKGTAATGAALLLWLGLVFFGDLGVMGATFALRPTPAVLLAMLLLNPLQIFRLSAIYSLHSTLDSLGPVGQYAVYRFGDQLPLILLGLLLFWGVLAFGVAFALFNRRRDV